MRVITELGLGNVEEWPDDSNQPVAVNLDTCGQKGSIVEIRRGEIPRQIPRKEAFPLTDYALLCLINMAGCGFLPNFTTSGFLSNLQFHPSLRDAKAVFNNPQPLNEVVLLLDLKKLAFQASCQPEIELETKSYWWLQPQIDRWSGEHSRFFDEKEQALERFDDWKRNTPSTKDGIFASALLDTSQRQILRFCISTPLGVVYQKARSRM